MCALELDLYTATEQEHSRLSLRKLWINLRKQRLWQILAALASVAFAWKLTEGLRGTEFSGGRITGPLLNMVDLGSLSLIVSALALFRWPRIAAAVALAGSLLCLPISVYFVAPGPFRHVVGGLWSVPLQSNFVGGPSVHS